jgi:hypothetical protein
VEEVDDEEVETVTAPMDLQFVRRYKENSERPNPADIVEAIQHFFRGNFPEGTINPPLLFAYANGRGLMFPGDQQPQYYRRRK